MTELGQRSIRVIKGFYIIGFFSLLSGVFYPIITGRSFSDTISGVIVLLIGLSGGLLVYRGATSDKSSTPFVITGLAIISISLVLILYLARVL